MFIAKPFNVASLDARIRQLLDVRTAIKENIRKELIIDPKETLITSDDDKFVANIINVIEDNIADVEFNIDKLASLLNISGYNDPRYFSNSFKKEFGMTPKQYSIQKKV